MKSDLHFHSKYSDGSQWPEEIVKRAKTIGFEMLALTDHDTMAGVGDFMQACNQEGIKGIPAVEIDFDGSEFDFRSELLAYFPGGAYNNTKKILDRIQEGRRQLAISVIGKFAEQYGCDGLSIDDLIPQKIGNKERFFNTADISITKRDLFLYFLARIKDFGYCDTNDEYKRFHKEVSRGEKTVLKPALKELLSIVRSDGGFPVMAHPADNYEKNIERMRSERDKCLMLFKNLKEVGLWGIEMHSYSAYTRDTLNLFFKDVAKETGLNITYGSDSHGKGDKDLMGVFFGDFNGFILGQLIGFIKC